MMNTVIIIPVLNPEDGFKDYIDELIAQDISCILVVNDGSDSSYDDLFKTIDSVKECTVLTHEVNCGKGRALKTALTFYQEHSMYNEFHGVITVDADGQHKVEDVLAIAQIIESIPEDASILIIGERTFEKEVPLRSRFGNVLTRSLFHMLYHVKLNDTQTGLRAWTNSLIEPFIQVEGERYEYEMNMLIYAAMHHIPLRTLPISTVYLEDNASSHFHPIKDSFRIYYQLLGTFVKYTFSSFACAIIDILLFTIFVKVMKGKTATNYIIFSTVLARCISACCNFIFNKKLVFHSKGDTARHSVKYIVLCIVQMLLSGYCTRGLFYVLHWKEWLIKIIVDTILFFMSYRVQKKYIFS